MNDQEFEIANEILTEMRGISNAINHASKFEVSFATCEAHKDYIEAKPSCVHCLRAENKRLNYEFREIGIQCGRLETENERLKGAIASALHRSRKEEWGPVIDVLGEALAYPKTWEGGEG